MKQSFSTTIGKIKKLAEENAAKDKVKREEMIRKHREGKRESCRHLD